MGLATATTQLTASGRGMTATSGQLSQSKSRAYVNGSRTLKSSQQKNRQSSQNAGSTTGPTAFTIVNES